MLDQFHKVALEELSWLSTLVTRTDPCAEYALISPPSCHLSCFLITLFFSRKQTSCHITHMLKLHVSRLSRGLFQCLFPTTYKLVLEVFLNQFVPLHAVMAHSFGQ